MPVVEARLRVHHPCPYCDISVTFPNSFLVLWCDNRRDVFLVSSPDSGELAEVVKARRDAFRGTPFVVDGSNALVSMPMFQWSEPVSITRLAEQSGVWVLPPVLYSMGRETYHLVAASQNAFLKLVNAVRNIGDVEVLSIRGRSSLQAIRDAPAVSTRFFEGLTEKQVKSLTIALERGLYEVPSRASWESVANSMGISRSTFGEHLRKATLRILRNSYPSLKVREGAMGSNVLLKRTTPPETPRLTPLQGTRYVTTDD